MKLADELRKIISGEVADDEATLAAMSRDASVFVVKPSVVVYPKDISDLSALVKFVIANKKKNRKLSLTARSAGTDMSGGPLSESIVVAFGRYFNRIKDIKPGYAVAEPGVFYRDFEKATLRYGSIMPAYPASRELCALGGIINNNSGGEKTLKYGKAENYIESVNVVLADGKEYFFAEIPVKEAKRLARRNDFEGEIYRKLLRLLSKNAKFIEESRPHVSKNSAGYALWNVWDRRRDTVNLAKLFIGAQGTLGFVTSARIRLVAVPKKAKMLIIFMNDLSRLGETINTVLPFKPESFESYDDNTLKLALKYFPSFARLMGTRNILSLGIKFLPELWMAATSGLPKLVLQAEFTGDNDLELANIIRQLKRKLQPFGFAMRVAETKEEARKYWLIRRESFNLLRNRIKDRHTAPFIDDIVVAPEKLPEFLPRLNAILAEYNLTYTMAGHIGNGNFHIIPLMNLKKKLERDIIPELSEKVYNLVFEFGGSTTGEHNDGLIRSPYLKQMYGDKMYKLFVEVGKIFDPRDIFNPGKKTDSSLSFAIKHIRRD